LCVLLAMLATATGLALRILVPVGPPDGEFLSRIEHWKKVAPIFDHERAERSRSGVR
ncbi:MAG: hypothetical protein K0R61_5660, partial [Microvirga sp.]|nr:hypothetical protein [Microvirga sp.]